MQINSRKISGFSKEDQEPKHCSVLLLKTDTFVACRECGYAGLLLLQGMI